MSALTTCLWFNGRAEEAVRFYESVFGPAFTPGRVLRAPLDYPAGRAGDVLTIDFSLFGQPFFAMNGGPQAGFTQAISLQVSTADQAETDRLWAALQAGGGAPLACGWLTDKFGLSWQITPARLTELMHHREPAVRARVMAAMMAMVNIDIAALEAAAAAGAGDDA